MAGHSKWAQIKRKKGVKDRQKSAIFSKLSHLITLSVSEGGGLNDPDLNVRLRLAVEKAKAANMPRSTIERAIEKGSGPGAQSLREVLYEGFGPAGTAYLIEVTTDNPNRAVVDVRHVLERYGGKLAGQGAVSYLFSQVGMVVFDKKQANAEKVLAMAEVLHAQDIQEDKESITLLIPPNELGRVKEVVGALVPVLVELDRKPQITVLISTKGDAKKILALMDALESLEEVQKVYSNFDIPEGFLEDSS